MKKIISFIIKILLSITTFLFVLLIIFLFYIFFLSYQNDTLIKDTTKYVITSFKNKIENSVLNENTNSNIDVNNISSDVPIDNNIIYQTSNNSSKLNFYYDQLDDTGKTVYKSLEDNINNLKKENFTLDFSTKFNTLLHESTGQYKLNKSFQSALDAFFCDHPELFYIDLTKMSLIIKYYSIASKTVYKVSMSPKDSTNYLCNGFESESQVNNAINEIERISNDIIKNLKNDSDYNKALKVHDSLIKLVEYNSTSQINSHSIYGAFIDGKAVCEGYAKAFKYLLDKLDVPCILVSGIGTNSTGKSESHMWNYVKLNDNWYGVDVTWDDPINATSSIIRYNYFCKGINDFVKSHNYEGKMSDAGMLFTIPILSKNNYE